MKYKYTLESQVGVQTDILGMDVNHPFFNLRPTGILTINKGYSWDGMTLYPDDPTTYYASLYHDCLYQMIQLKLISSKYKSNADKLLYTTLVQEGHPKIKALVVYIAVSVFGNFFLKQ